MNNQTIRTFIRRHEDLFWSSPTKSKEEISMDLLVETILNFGTLDDVRELICLLGREEVARTFSHATERKALNYFPEIHNLFTLYFSRNA